MRLLLRSLLLLSLSVVLVACTNPLETLFADPPAKVNDYVLSRTELDDRVSRIEIGLRKNPNVTQMPTKPELDDYVIEQFVVQHVIMSIAKDKGIAADKAAVDKQLEDFRTAVSQSGSDEFDVVISDQLGYENATDPDFLSFVEYFVLQTKLAATLVDEATVRAEIQADLEEQAQSKELQARVQHILVEDEATAVRVIELLKEGKEFGTLAAEFSTDPGSKDNEGIYEWTGRGYYVAEFDKAVFDDLKVGEYTQTPVKTDFGFHVIKVLGREERSLLDPATIPNEIEVRLPSLLDQRRYEALQVLIDEERTKGVTEERIVIQPTAVVAVPTAGIELEPTPAP
jgi:parvulin-like peptidyl-prolyl isomerase